MNRMLVVEDDPLVIESLGGVLEDLGFEALFATNMKFAEQMLRNLEFDIVITDHEFPGGDSESVLKLAHDAKISRVILFSSSGRANPSLFDKAFAKDFIGLMKYLKSLRCCHSKKGKCRFMQNASDGQPVTCDGFDTPCPGYYVEED